MTLAGHIAISGLVMQVIPDPVLMITTNVVLHPLLDSIPHAEWHTFVNEHQSRTLAILFTLADVVFSVCYIWLLVTHLPYTTGLIYLGLFAGIWADLLELLVSRFWPGFVYWHRYTHSWPEKPTEPIDWSKSLTGRTPTWVKLSIQFILIVGPLALLLRT
ncbi:MAG: hypothetical protein Q7K33_03700 [Candidatus Berkelbacteria bacterium]|nr:hypothetical protein [Candidatus Berkelbacteria bacterium]